MDAVALIMGLSWIFGGVLIIAVSVPLLTGRVKRNRWYGVRLPQSLASDQARRAINRHGAKCLIGWSVPMILAGAAILFLPLRDHPAAAMALGAAPLLFVLIPAIQSWRFARRYPQQSDS